MNFITLVTIMLWSVISTTNAAEPTLLINCGLPRSFKSVSSFDSLVWQSDDDPAFAPPNINSISTSFTTDLNGEPPYKVGRLISSPIIYRFSISPGPKFIRLYFSTSVSYNNITPYQFSTTLLVNNFTLLKNFNPFLNSPNEKSLQYEFQIIVQHDENYLNFSFSPGEDDNINNTHTSSSPHAHGYINGIEILSVPDGLYLNESTLYTYVTDMHTGFPINRGSAAFQTMYRLNVGGELVDAWDDNSGGMNRTWEADEAYVFTDYPTSKIEPHPNSAGYLDVRYTNKTPNYVAPKMVYGSARIMGENLPDSYLARNITWILEVDPGFDYLVRLHFRELIVYITGPGQMRFDVYIGGMIAATDVDIWAEAGGFGIPIYRDYVISLPGGDAANGSKYNLSIVLCPIQGYGKYFVDVLLNGMEILKLSSNGIVAFQNPACQASCTTPEQNQRTTPRSSSNKSRDIIVGGVIGGLLLLVIILIALFRRRVKYTKLFTSAKSSSWLPTSTESQTTSATTNSNSSRPSLPSDLCRRFSLSQIKVATSDFDQNSIIGTGGFGKVYKGCVDDGATTVAIKRLNPLSKQGAHEFFTEIEMLSKLRHVHLVSLIGYCDDQGEMILVYEYMPRGTLRDHLKYKDANNVIVDDEVLSWKQRLMICIGSARGLDYLHSGTKQLIIHRDVKSTNILLDDKWTAKVSDFGLSKVGPASETGIGHVSTAVKGSIGYLDPEYYRRRQLTEKSDVYSLGVVLFEVLCARQVVSPNLPREQVSLANWGKSCYKKGILHTIVDPNLTGQIAPECLKKFGEIAEMCIRNDGDERPSMRDIVWSLEFALTLQQTAEKNSSDGSPMVQVTSRGGVDNGGTDDGSTNNDVFTNSIEENVSESSGARLLQARNFGGYSTSTNSETGTTTNYHNDMRSALVFSEILDPQAR